MALDMAGKGDFGGFVDKYAFLRPCKIPICSLKYFCKKHKRHKKKILKKIGVMFLFLHRNAGFCS